MRTTFLIILGLGCLLLTSGIIVFHFCHDLSWLDAAYFTITIMSTVGFGDISLLNASPGVKIFGMGLMLSSAALMAATLGIITDFVLKTRLEHFFHRRKSHMRNHIVLCGLGHVGIRVLEQLRKIDEEVVVIEKAPDNRFLDDAKRMQTHVVIGDASNPSVLERVNIKEARSIIAATDDDLLNLEVALNARAVRPDIRVVLRMFDSNLATKIRSGFGIRTTFSTSALAAPAFAMAAIDPAVVGSFYVGDELVLISQLLIAAESKLVGQTVAKLREHGEMSILCHQAANNGSRSMHPDGALALAVGDTITVSASVAVLGRLKAL